MKWTASTAGSTPWQHQHCLLRTRPTSYTDYDESCRPMHPRRTASELAPNDVWIKSSYSDPGQNCVEAAPLNPDIAIRDSKNPNGPALLLPAKAWQEFIAHLTDM
ncbi:DUF397 domain-containing protein [Streptomyces sp. NPDC086549]|uniref:DUF397 domain-containing protein n=1 Tax=Streptomyces sp. NPDC086549 TaxID=3365752 RepID=UPI00382CB819